jgi:hypothetical protein
MKNRDISVLTAEQSERLNDLSEAIQNQEIQIEVIGLHPRLDHLVGYVEDPFDGWTTKDLAAASLFVFGTAKKLKMTAESIAADFALQRDRSYGL